MRRNYSRYCWLFGVAACGVTTPLFGQSSATLRRPPLAAQDSVVTHLVTTTLLAQLAGEIAEAALRDSIRPWVIGVPTDAGALRWSQIAAAVRGPLRARDRLPSDGAYRALQVREVVYTRDSLVVEFFIGGQRACGVKFTGGGTEYRAAMAWPAYPSPYVSMLSNPLEYSDSAACRTP